MQQQLERIFHFFKAGDFSAAMELIGQIEDSLEENADLMNMAGISLFRCGKKDAGLLVMQRSVELFPHLVQLRIHFASLLQESGRFQDAAREYHSALGATPPNPQQAPVWRSLAGTYLSSNEPHRALECARKLYELGVRDADTLNLLGVAHGRIGQGKDAANFLRQAIRLQPTHANALNNIGHLFSSLGRFEEAREYLRRSVACSPRNVDALNNLGNLLRRMGQVTEAVQTLERALNLSPQLPELWNNQGLAFLDLGVSEKAVESFDQAIALSPSYAIAYVGRGLAMEQDEHWEQACESLRRASDLAPEDASCNYNFGACRLRLGDYENGWPLYEWRKKLSLEYSSIYGIKLLTDSLDVQGKTVHVYSEQGFGESIQFSRYLYPLARQARRIVLSCPQPLEALFGRMPGVDDCIGERPMQSDFDVRIALPSLPLALGMALVDPQQEVVGQEGPWLCADPAKKQHWREILGECPGRLRVGLVWAGNSLFPKDWMRSPGLDAYAALLDLPEIQFFSLQCDESAKRLAQPPWHGRIVDLSPRLSDFDETAAAIENMDLIISSDTSVLHLAGSLSVPVWGILWYGCDWRWGLGGERSDWYPNMRLYRQEVRQDWTQCLARVCDDLREWG
ncbi:MAG: tetratricopeptide repeat protein [Candidatus Eutrophobiaceae bacterium]